MTLNLKLVAPALVFACLASAFCPRPSTPTIANPISISISISSMHSRMRLHLSFSEDSNEDTNRENRMMTRREIVNRAAAITATASLVSIPVTPLTASAAASTSANANANAESKSIPFSTSWSATSGLNKAETSDFVSFDPTAYQAMRDDLSRTPLFQKALVKRIQSQSTPCTVLDLGTGPYALFAILAAQAGAAKVYAIEADAQAAAVARTTIQKAGFADVVTVVEGYSTQITSLPELADVIVAEIVGSIASEEGAYATILDAGRFLKDPTQPANWIPNRIQTYAAPASYTLHNMFGPPAFDWSKLRGEPVRFNCRDEGLQLLADPVLVEDLDFSQYASSKTATKNDAKQHLSFTVDVARIKENKSAFYTNLRSARLPGSEAADVATDTANTFSGLAFWPRLILDDDIVVNSRSFPDGDHQKSHWQTVLPIVSDRPIPLQPGDVVDVTVEFNRPTKVTTAPDYRVDGNVVLVASPVFATD